MTQFILECIKYELDERRRRTPNRKMIGPYQTQDDALNAMLELRRTYDDILAHTLYSPDDDRLRG